MFFKKGPKMNKIEYIKAREILDSRGYPTIEADVYVEGGIMGRASAATGIIKGKREAAELRDGDKSRYQGRGVLKAIEVVNERIAPNIIGMDVTNQRLIDMTMIDLDGTADRSNFGANTMLAISMAVAQAGAKTCGLPLYKYLGGTGVFNVPVPLFNIINGGGHADNLIDFQEFMIAPVSAGSFSDAVKMGSEVFHELRKILSHKGHSVNIGDEGGIAPALESTREVLEYITEAIEQAGYVVGQDFYIALDIAANQLYRNGQYHLVGEGKVFSTEEFIDYCKNLVADYPIYSLEDPMAETDEGGWRLITQELSHKIQIVGDDLFVTHKDLLANGIKKKMGNSILIKPNQVGTVSETLETIEFAHRNNYSCIISHRSGETEDCFISHLVVSAKSGQIKAGSVVRSERTAKYNELIRIEEELGVVENYYGKQIIKGNYVKY